jgi:hypothetical protein
MCVNDSLYESEITCGNIYYVQISNDTWIVEIDNYLAELKAGKHGWLIVDSGLQ